MLIPFEGYATPDSHYKAGYNDGLADAFAGTPSAENPWIGVPETTRHKEWERGWLAGWKVNASLYWPFRYDDEGQPLTKTDSPL